MAAAPLSPAQLEAIRLKKERALRRRSKLQTQETDPTPMPGVYATPQPTASLSRTHIDYAATPNTDPTNNFTVSAKRSAALARLEEARKRKRQNSQQTPVFPPTPASLLGTAAAHANSESHVTSPSDTNVVSAAQLRAQFAAATPAVKISAGGGARRGFSGLHTPQSRDARSERSCNIIRVSPETPKASDVVGVGGVCVEQDGGRWWKKWHVGTKEKDGEGEEHTGDCTAGVCDEFNNGTPEMVTQKESERESLREEGEGSRETGKCQPEEEKPPRKSMTATELARMLGLLAPTPLCSASLKESTPSDNYARQELDFLVVVDFEATCWDKNSDSYFQEIIEFPAVLVSLRGRGILSTFHAYVRPVVNPVLSSFCAKLTGIGQATVDAAVTLPHVLDMFSRWLAAMEVEHNLHLCHASACGHCGDSKRQIVALASWSDWDFGMMLHTQLQWLGLPRPWYYGRWVDVRTAYRSHYDRKPEGVRGSMLRLGLPFTGRQHSGVDDATNTARLCLKMVEDGCVFRITTDFDQQQRQLCDTTPSMKPITPCKVEHYYSLCRLARPGVPEPITADALLPDMDMIRQRQAAMLESGAAVDASNLATPPLCDCGRRAKRKVSRKPGPNLGRHFFSCAFAASSPMKCKFFQWDSGAQLDS